MSSIAYRADVDGLRAVSVLGVLFFHAGMGFPGGFVGVDVFFVISGFLITSILLKELNAGRFELADFWVRRIRRILPAVSVMVAIVLIASLLLLDPQAVRNLAKSSVAQAAMLANVFFLRDINYFSDAAEYKPLLHTWSLAVEEQFYLAYPLLVGLVHRYCRKFLIPFLFTAALLSLGYCVYLTSHDEATAFFLLPSRAWEMLAGGIAAATYGRFSMNRYCAEAISGLGMVAIAIAMFFFTKGTTFPGVAALLPVAGATAVILGGGNGMSTVVGTVLSLPVFVFVGRISYSLYLWHWPLLAFAKNILIEDSLLLRTVLLMLSFALAYLSWRFVEEPFRKRAILRNRVIAYSYGFTTCLLLLVASYAIYKTDGLPGRFQPEYQVLFDDMSWTGDQFLSRNGKAKSLGVQANQGDDSIDFVLWGDSHGMAVAEAVDQAAKKKGLAGRAFLQSSLIPVTGLCRPGWDAETKRSNMEQNEETAQFVVKNKVPLVLLVSRWSSNCSGLNAVEAKSGRDPSSTLVTDEKEARQGQLSWSSAQSSVQRQLQSMVTRFEEAGAQVLILKQVPENNNIDTARDFYLSQHLPRFNTMDQFTISRSDHQERQKGANDVMGAIESTCLTIRDPAPLLFSSLGKLKVYEKRSLYRDDNHLSRYGALEIMRPLFEEIFEQYSPE